MSNAYFIDILYFTYICGTHSNMLVFIKTAALQDASRGKQGLGGICETLLTVVHSLIKNPKIVKSNPEGFNLSKQVQIDKPLKLPKNQPPFLGGQL